MNGTETSRGKEASTSQEHRWRVSRSGNGQQLAPSASAPSCLTSAARRSNASSTCAAASAVCPAGASSQSSSASHAVARSAAAA